MAKGEDSGVAAEWVEIGAIRPWSRNPRPIKAKDVRDLARSIKRFGFSSPIIARRADGEIIAGHARYAAARRLKMAKVPVRYLELTTDEAHALALADNKLQENRDWDDDALQSVLEELEAAGTDLTVGTGFDDDDIEKLLGSEEDAYATPDVDASAKLDGLEYRIVIECRDEMHQVELIDRFEAEGLKCKPLMS
jgi:ParB-like chromosome segregation protein Spo0J